MPKTPLIITAVICLIAGLALGWLRIRADSSPIADSPIIICDAPLTDHLGATITLADMHDYPTLIYFGYTFCPDICPTELGYMSRLMKALGPQATHLRAYFVSIDPNRDTPEKLREYVQLFNSPLRGISGTPEHIRDLASAFGVYYDRVDVSGAKASHYLMNHTSTIFVLDRDGRMAGKMDSHMPIADALAMVRGVL